MSVIMDVAIATSIVLDVIEAFQKKGITIRVSDLEFEIAKREAEKKELNEKLGIRDDI